ncbi:glycosyltransferase family 4 protein [Tunicatimonas pelagia]|uniref:glycosyltransferase family 4 protein n=1 Tax=Tunicatimonas pelagia TaxID=931531 RepID=UPI0026665EA7|nr:glycosyltransferase [Tunicatimonas pelagia]WKN40703.1 glycosyltransferase [Tunicatimonas pelagia]
MKKILVVGQTPPPYHGQAISTQRLLDGDYEHIQLYLVRLYFSKEIDEVGKFKASKVVHLLKVIARIYYYRFRYRIDVLYYMPTGAKWMPLIRDVAILLATRWLFRKTVFHFHMAGVNSLFSRLPSMLKPFYRRAYYYPDLSIKLSKHNPTDDIALKSKQTVVVYNGVEDYYSIHRHLKKNSIVPTILFVGIIQGSKGIYELLEIAQRLHTRGIVFELRLVGKTDSVSTDQKIRAYIQQHRLQHRVKLIGIKTGEDKWQEYINADVFCFPSHFETFGLVLIEAMQFKLPVVTTRIGGIQSVVRNEETGYLVPLQNIEAFTKKVEKLLVDNQLRTTMGDKGRAYFLQNFTVKHYWQNMEQVLSQEL